MLNGITLSAAMLVAQIGAPPTPYSSADTPAAPAVKGLAPGRLTTAQNDPGNVIDEAPASPAEAPAAEESTVDKWLLMRMLGGFGEKLEKRRLSMSGWVQQSFTTGNASTDNVPAGSNAPVVWNDRVNRYSMHQLWARLDRALDTDSDKMSVGGRADFFYGTDYRFTLMRGLFNNQLNAAGAGQQWYGYDLPQFYANMYLPNVMKGLEIRGGKMFCPWGVESIEGVSAPFLSRSYAFNWSPPFTHFGVMGILNLTEQVVVNAMVANGNDVWVNQISQQPRFVGKIQWTGKEKKQSIGLAASLSQAELDTTQPFAPTTVGLQSEPLGRNNLNAIDLVYTLNVGERLSLAYEGIYGWQYAPPGTATFDADGFANWYSNAVYAFLQIRPKLKLQWRGEIFHDVQGQRTFFPGVYYATTAGFAYSPRKGFQIRPEVRWDYNSEAAPFDNGTRNQLFTAAVDAILRF